MSEGLLNTILPILMTGVTAIGITTKGVGEHNIVNEMFDRLKSSGQQSMVKFLDIEYVCEECKKNNAAIHCRHRLDLIPYWLQPERMDILKLMVPDPDSFIREILGLSVDSSVKLAFDPLMVDDLMATPFDTTSSLLYEIRDIYVSIDPAGGGKKSNYTITSCMYLPGNIQVVSIILFIELFYICSGEVHRCSQVEECLSGLFFCARVILHLQDNTHELEVGVINVGQLTQSSQLLDQRDLRG